MSRRSPLGRWRPSPRALVALPLCLAVGAGRGVGPSADPTAGDFVFEVLPLLQRQGCASAYCHGAATGQGGFKLSLFGSDPDADYAAVTRALGGRRLDLVEPEQSLLLQKPLRRLDHGGGRRLQEGSAEHLRLRAWIAAGAPYARDRSERLTDLTLRREGERLNVEARFVDEHGARVADVGQLAVFSSSDERVARVDRDGRIDEVGPGEAFLFARYGGRSARVAVTRAFGASGVDAAAQAPLDVAFAARMRALGLTPAPAAEPARLLRRLHLDLTGMPPSSQALRRFLSLPAATRVQTTVDELVATPAFAETLARRLAAWLELPADDDSVPPPQRARARTLRARVARFAAADAPWSDLTRALLDPDGPFLRQREDPRDRAELVARTVLGVRVGCARCHDHPHDRWRQRDHLAFAACFADRRPVPSDGVRMEETPPGVLFDASSGQPVAPRLLPLIADVPAPAELHAFVHDRRHDLAARALCNRVFAWLLGRGLVEPLDDHRDTNPAAHETWLATLQSVFHDGGDRLRPLVAALATSRLYQLDSASDEPPDDPRARFFAWRTSKPLDPDTLRRAMAATLGVAESTLPPLPRSPLRRRLELLGGEGLTQALHARGNALEALQAIGGDPREQLEALFEACLSRPPTDAEQAALLPDFDAATCAFALLNSREFEFLR